MIITMNLVQAVNSAIRAEAGTRRISIAELARISGIPERSLIRYLTGERVMNVDQFGVIAEALGMQVEGLMAEAVRRLSLPEPDWDAIAAKRARKPDVDPDEPIDVP